MSEAKPDHRRLTRHQMQEPDQFLSTMDHLVRYAATHRRQVWTGMAVGVVAVAGIVSGILWWQGQQAKSSAALANLFDLAARPVRGEPGAASASGSAGETFPDLASRDNALVQEAELLLKEHGDSGRVGTTAKLFKAQALLHRGRLGEASPLYAAVAGTTPRNAIEVAATFGQASAQAASGDVDGAISRLQLLASSGSPFVPKDLALKLAAEVAEHAGRSDQAAKLFQRVADEAKDSPLAAAAKAKAKELAEKAAPEPATTGAGPSPGPGATP